MNWVQTGIRKEMFIKIIIFKCIIKKKIIYFCYGKGEITICIG